MHKKWNANKRLKAIVFRTIPGKDYKNGKRPADTKKKKDNAVTIRVKAQLKGMTISRSYKCFDKRQGRNRFVHKFRTKRSNEPFIKTRGLLQAQSLHTVSLI